MAKYEEIPFDFVRCEYLVCNIFGRAEKAAGFDVRKVDF